MTPRRGKNVLLALFCGTVLSTEGFLAPFVPRTGVPSRNMARSAGVGPIGSATLPQLFSSSTPSKGKGGTALSMIASGADKLPDKSVIANVGALGFAAGCSVVASAVAEISPHAAAFVQLVCLSIWLGMSVYATFVWPVITGYNMRDSSEFASLLGKLGPSYLQLSVAMIMSLGTSSVVIGHANEVQLVILGCALSITLYNALVLEPSALVALEEELAVEKVVEKRKRSGNSEKIQGEDLTRLQANMANFLGAEVLLDLLCILCAVCYAWDLASSITFA